MYPSMLKISFNISISVALVPSADSCFFAVMISWFLWLINNREIVPAYVLDLKSEVPDDAAAELLIILAAESLHIKGDRFLV
jgi:hypothetical protein